MNNRRKLVLAHQLGQALAHRPRVISVPLTSALLEMEERHLKRLEHQGLFPDRVDRADGSPGYDLGAIYTWLNDFSNAPR